MKCSHMQWVMSKLLHLRECGSKKEKRKNNENNPHTTPQKKEE